MTDVLKGLYARRDEIRGRIGDRLMSLSRIATAANVTDEFIDESIFDLHLSLQSLEAQISAYQRHAI